MNDSQVFDDLAYLRKVVEDSRRVVVDNGVGLLTWGILVVIGMILTYASVHLGLDLPSTLVWSVVIGAGWLLSIWLGWINMKRSRTRTFIQKVLWSIWVGLGITMTIIGFVGPLTGTIAGRACIPIISLVLGAGFFATATIHQEKLLTAAAAGWWIGGIATMVLPGDFSFLLFAGMMTFFQIAPGVYLYKKWKKEIKSER